MCKCSCRCYVNSKKKQKFPAQFKEIRHLRKQNDGCMLNSGDGKFRVWNGIQGRPTASRTPSRDASEATNILYKLESRLLAYRIPVGFGHHFLLWFLIFLFSSHFIVKGSHLCVGTNRSSPGFRMVAPRLPLTEDLSPRQSQVVSSTHPNLLLLSQLISNPSENSLPSSHVEPDHFSLPPLLHLWAEPPSSQACICTAASELFSGFCHCPLPTPSSSDLLLHNSPVLNLMFLKNTHLIDSHESVRWTWDWNRLILWGLSCGCIRWRWG